MTKDRMKRIMVYFLNGSIWKIIVNKYRSNDNVFFAYGKDAKAASKKFKVYKSLLRYKNSTDISLPEKFKDEKIIWSLWLQGEENAPDVVKACLDSHKKICGYTSIVLTEETIQDYITLPVYIWDKYRGGQIGNAHFSDIVRVELLLRYGGIWCDATCYYSGNGDLPSYIEDSEMFVFKNLMSGTDTIVASNWFIKGNGNSAILQMVRNILYEYWKDKKRATHYFIFHFFFKMATEMYPIEWEQVPSVNNVTPHELQLEMNKMFDKNRWNYLCASSSFHKLTYVNELQKGSYLEYIINREM